MKSLNTVSTRYLTKPLPANSHSLALAIPIATLSPIQKLFTVCLAFALALFYSSTSSANMPELSMDFAIVEDSIDISPNDQNRVKQRNVCRAIRSDVLGRSAAQQNAKALAQANGLSSYQQRAYRTRVGGTARSLPRDLAFNNCW